MFGLQLQHLDTPAFSLDKNGNRIVKDIKCKEIEDMRPLSDFCEANIKQLLDDYLEITSILKFSSDLKEAEQYAENLEKLSKEIII